MRRFIKIRSEIKPVGFGKNKEDKCIIYPEFMISGKDIMRKGGNFYAILDPKTEMWSTNQNDVYRIIDEELYSYAEEHYKEDGFGIRRDSKGHEVVVKSINDSSTRLLLEFNKWFNNLSPNHNYIPLDSDLTFLSDEVTADMYRSKRLKYDLVDGNIESYMQMFSVLYSDEDRTKLEWAIGSILSGDSKKIEKMVVLYGKKGTGKSTVIDLIEEIFDGYWHEFVAEELALKSHQFATAAFKDNPLVAIQDDGSLAKIDSPRINEIVSHRVTQINEKNTKQYSIKPNAMLFLATNDLVDIHDTNMGIARRIIDVYPTYRILPVKEYRRLVNQIMKFEIPAIAKHCLDVYKELGKEYFVGYEPVKMINKTNYLRNFILDNQIELMRLDPITRDMVYTMYVKYFEDSGLGYPPKRLIFGEQLKEYYEQYDETKWLNGKTCRHVYTGLKEELFNNCYNVNADKEQDEGWLKFNCRKSIFDKWCIEKGFPAQYDTGKDIPIKSWSKIKTTLNDLDSTKLHWVNIPVSEKHIRIDFDFKDKDGNKDLKKNIEEANKFPQTYAEISQSGGGVHLHYFYDGDVLALDKNYGCKEIEIKTDKGDQGCRRKLTKCNNIPMATLHLGSLPLKGEKNVVTEKGIKDERHLRNLVVKNLKKEIHSGTKPSVDFIYELLEQAYKSGIQYDVSDIANDVMVFAAKSTNHSAYCLKLVSKMHFKSEDTVKKDSIDKSDEKPIAFFDVEVFPNVFILCWKYAGDATVTRMINPRPEDVEWLFKNLRMIGFNNRRYDNHICWAWIQGYTNRGLYELSQKIIVTKKGEKSTGFFGQAYNASYLDVYDLASNPHKMSLKKWEIKLHDYHLENSYPWDEDLPEDKWLEVCDYCENDVKATEHVYNEIKGDVAARLILSKISGLLPNDTTNNHSMQIIFGDDKNPQSQFVYTYLNKMFKDYLFENGVSTYKGYTVGEGGFVWAKPGVYRNVWTFDVASMHPSSLIALNLFGDIYTQRFKEIKDARLAVKHKDRKALETLLDGQLLEFYDIGLEGKEFTLGDLATALKTVINSVYGLTFAGFPNRCRDERNVDNIVAKRGALFMVDLKEAVEKMGGKVIHIKTDSIKVVDPSEELKKFIIDFGKSYGYDFEVEAIYDRICLVNDAVYIAKEDNGEWTATGAEFAHPYIFKTLFSKEDIDIYDLAETKSVGKGELYLDFNENLDEDEHAYQFVGKVSSFLPVREGCGGAELLVKRDDKYVSAAGAKGLRWLETEYVKQTGKLNEWLDQSYYDELVDKAIKHINEFGDFEKFLNDENYDPKLEEFLKTIPDGVPEEIPFEEGSFFMNKPIVAA